MSFSISVSGHIADPQATKDDVIEIFDNTIRALRALGADPGGSVSGTVGTEMFTRTAGNVVELDAADADADDIDDEPADV